MTIKKSLQDGIILLVVCIFGIITMLESVGINIISTEYIDTFKFTVILLLLTLVYFLFRSIGWIKNK